MNNQHKIKEKLNNFFTFEKYVKMTSFLKSWVKITPSDSLEPTYNFDPFPLKNGFVHFCTNAPQII